MTAIEAHGPGHNPGADPVNQTREETYPVVRKLPEARVAEVLDALAPGLAARRGVSLTLRGQVTSQEFSRIFGPEETLGASLGLQMPTAHGEMRDLTLAEATRQKMSWQQRPAVALAANEDPPRDMRGRFNRLRRKPEEMTPAAGRALMTLAAINPDRAWDVAIGVIVRTCKDLGLTSNDLLRDAKEEKARKI